LSPVRTSRYVISDGAPQKDAWIGGSITDEEPFPVTTRKRKSLFRRFLTFVAMLITGSGAGLGGWMFKDHPRVQAFLATVLNKTGAEADATALENELASAVSSVIEGDQSRQPGLYKVKITEIKLDPKLFKSGRTVDLQTRVRKLDQAGREQVVWESQSYGENLSLVGKDDISAAFVNRPFEIQWSPGDRIIVEVWDRRGGHVDGKKLTMALPEPGVFPLTSGVHALEVRGRSGTRMDSDFNRIVFETQHLSESQKGRQNNARIARSQDSKVRSPQDVAERPIVIK
jgi:hypothetical protein